MPFFFCLCISLTFPPPALWFFGFTHPLHYIQRISFNILIFVPMHSLTVVSVVLAASQVALSAPIAPQTRGIPNPVSALAGHFVKEGSGNIVSEGLSDLENLFKRKSSAPPEEEEESGPGLGTTLASSAVGGASGAAVTNILNKIESLFKRELEGLSDLEKRKSSAPSEEEESGPGLGTTLASSAVGGASGAAVTNILNKIESLFKRELEGLSDLEKRKSSAPSEEEESGPGLGTTLASSAVGGASGAAVTNILNKIESLFKRELEGLSDLEKRKSSAPSEEEESGPGLGTTLASSAVGGASGAAVTNILNKIESLFKRELEGLSDLEKRKSSAPSEEEESGPGLGTTLASSAVGGASGAAVTNILNKIESLFKRELEARQCVVPSAGSDVESDGTFGPPLNPDLEARQCEVGSAVRSLVKRSSSPPEEEEESGPGLGTTLASSAVSGASGAAVSNILNKIESLFKRELEARQVLKLAIQYEVGSAVGSLIKRASSAPSEEEGSTPSIGSTVVNSAVNSAVSAAGSGVSKEAVSTLLTKIESLFKRELEARQVLTLTAQARADYGTESLGKKRSLSDLD
ncbi:hypothetical protein K439DRAFT_1565090 [Ramaria rubella]|nr:hypothetical protein K439DRAFT_1565090 [Ramaria rubella]